MPDVGPAVSISPAVYAELNNLARLTGDDVPTLIAKAVEEYRRHLIGIPSVTIEWTEEQLAFAASLLDRDPEPPTPKLLAALQRKF